MLILASNSETRAQLLKNYGVAFVQQGVDFDEEQIRTEIPKSFVYEATKGKFEACPKTDQPILVADTVLEVDGELVRKAKDIEDARRILMKQSGNRLSIITCMIYKDRRLELLDISATHYRFAPFEREDLDRYLDSGIWMGKAGACMVEGFCRKYIQEVIGYESTAMGLCVEKLLPFLEK